MFIIVGLGNPGSEYEKTRHNVGFDVISILADRYGIKTDHLKHRARIGKGVIEGNKVILAMPQTYMNRSGESIRELVEYYKADVSSELLIVFDDVHLEPGRIRIRKAGSAGGHNGMKNIIDHLGTGDITRIRIGVGEKPGGGDLADHVLGHFAASDRKAVDEACIMAADSVVTIMNDGIDEAMNRFNRKREIDEGT